MEWSGMEQSGVESSEKVNGVDEWSGMDGMEYNGIDWSGVKWTGVEWFGVQKNRLK